jgi:hypothetical protein
MPQETGPEMPAGQRFLNCGVRFSTKAAMPSFWSWVANMAWKVRRSNRSPSYSGAS